MLTAVREPIVSLHGHQTLSCFTVFWCWWWWWCREAERKSFFLVRCGRCLYLLAQREGREASRGAYDVTHCRVQTLLLLTSRDTLCVVCSYLEKERERNLQQLRKSGPPVLVCHMSTAKIVQTFDNATTTNHRLFSFAVARHGTAQESLFWNTTALRNAHGGGGVRKSNTRRKRKGSSSALSSSFHTQVSLPPTQI